MIDKKTETDIKAIKGFLEYWAKFHSIYQEIIAKEIITNDDEVRFLEIKAVMKKKYEELVGKLEFKYALRGRLSDPINDILLLDGIRLVSEKNLKRLADDWNDSYVFLNNILERLKSKKRRLGQFNPVAVFMKRILR